MIPYELFSRFNHELRNPLCTIHNLLYILRREPLSKAQLQFFNDLEDATLDIESLLNLLFEYCKLDQPNSQHHSEPVDMPELLNSMASTTRQRWPNLQLVIAETFDPNCPVDSTRVRPLLLNIIDRFASHSPSAKLAIRYQRSERLRNDSPGRFNILINVNDHDLPMAVLANDQTSPADSASKANTRNNLEALLLQKYLTTTDTTLTISHPTEHSTELCLSIPLAHSPNFQPNSHGHSHAY